MDKLKLEINLNKSSGNFWIDNGLVVLFDLLGNCCCSVESALNFLIKALLIKTGNKETFFNYKNKSIEQYEKQDWKFPANNFIKSNPSAPKIILTYGHNSVRGEINETYYKLTSIQNFFKELESKGLIQIYKRNKKIQIFFDKLDNLPKDLKKLFHEKRKKIILSPPEERSLNLGTVKAGTCDVCEE